MPLVDAVPESYTRRVIEKETCMELIRKDLKQIDIMQFVQNLSKKRLSEWTKIIEKEVLTARNMNNPNNSAVMKKRLRERLLKDGLKKYVKERNASSSLLYKTIEDMGIIFSKDEPRSTNKEEITEFLFEVIRDLSLEYIFHELSVKLLQQMAAEAGLKVPSDSKGVLVRSLVDDRNYEGRELKDGTIKKPKEKLPKKVKNEGQPKARYPQPKDIDLVFAADDDKMWDEKKNPPLKDIKIGFWNDFDYDFSDEDDASGEWDRKKDKKRRKGKNKHDKKDKHDKKKSSRHHSDSDEDNRDSKKKDKKREHNTDSDDDRDSKKKERKREDDKSKDDKEDKVD